jgi:ABC-2 type transport system ATP-binding protein
MNSQMDLSRVAAAQAAPPLRATRLVKSYRDRRVLDDVSLTLEPGTVLGLIGSNGAGKSTLIRAMMGLIDTDSGECVVWGKAALRMDDATKARLGYVPQQPESLAWMTVRQALEFVGSFYPRWDHAYVETTLKSWRLPEDTPLASLSPGERQRVAILRALAPQPELLVLDEPAAALDPAARRALLREIANRAGESGTTVLFSTHIVSDLERVASHVAILHAGRLLLHDELDALKERCLHVQVPEYMVKDCSNVLPGEISRRRDRSGALSLLLVRDPDGAWPTIVGCAGIRSSVLSLEDLVVEVTG